ncbi:hypothetical protein IW261DRAFT_1426070 [Armillaria novae-zelandiae]|uniref:Uncharacterized protein n=1 Tax=Armillaria novae-zelandiae TaxID=153914 RepID=A0AA39NNL5_9AGAR|nr:hypothetical protein IW261DRAFT_1426070 [Armillaria novae-zelandiae]
MSSDHRVADLELCQPIGVDDDTTIRIPAPILISFCTARPTLVTRNPFPSSASWASPSFLDGLFWEITSKHLSHTVLSFAPIEGIPARKGLGDEPSRTPSSSLTVVAASLAGRLSSTTSNGATSSVCNNSDCVSSPHGTQDAPWSNHRTFSRYKKKTTGREHVGCGGRKEGGQSPTNPMSESSHPELSQPLCGIREVIAQFTEPDRAKPRVGSEETPTDFGRQVYVVFIYSESIDTDAPELGSMSILD